MNARELALNVLYKIEIGEGYSNITLDKELNKADLSSADKALASQIVYGVITWKITLDEIIKRYSKVKLKKISPWIINILRMGIYQICFLDKIPESAAVNESVKLAKKYGHIASSKYTNAILRNISKEEVQKLEEYINMQDYSNTQKISILTSHNEWMVDKLIKDYGEDFTLELLKANNKTPDITIRINSLKATREEALEKLKLLNVEAQVGNLPQSIFVKRINSFDEDYFVVQDEAAQLACIKLEPKENEMVLDACSSPGGKTTYLAELMHNKGHIDAWDLHEHRAELVKKLGERLGITIINACVNNATIYKKELEKKYEKILLDVPCSGIGVIRKKPDIKWTRNEEDLEELINTQYKILDTCSKYLKQGGTLVYSTCTVFKDENERQIEKFLKEHKEFKLVEEIKLFPNVDNTDGFYIAKLTM